MRLWEVFSFEIRYQMGRYLTWIYFIVVLGFAALAGWSMIDNVEKGEYFMNSPVVIGVFTAISTMFCLLLTATISGNAAVRDIQTGMDPLLYTSSIKKKTFLAGRFLAVFFLCLLVIIVVLILIFTASHIPVYENYFMENHFVSYLRSFLLVGVPNIFVSTAILFSISLLSRKAMAAYLGAGLLFFISMIGMDILAAELGLWNLGKRLDLSGMTVLQELKLLHSPIDLPVTHIPLQGSLLENRMIWLAAGLIISGFAYMRFKFIHHTSQRKRRNKEAPGEAVINNGIQWNTPVNVPVIERIFTFKTRLQQAGYLSRIYFGQMLKGKVWLLLVGMLIIVAIAAEEVMEGIMGVPILPTTWRTLQLMELTGVGMAVALLITYYTGELVWRERDVRVDEITDVSPVPDWVLLISKLAGLVLLLLVLQGLIFITGIVVQISHGYYEFDLLLYFQVLFGFRFLDLLLFSIIAYFIQILVNQKYLAYLLVFASYFYMHFPGMLGLEHKLLIFGSGPSIAYSAFGNFEPNMAPWVWFKIFWIGWALIMLIAAHLFWNRGKELRFTKKLARARIQLSDPTVKAGIPLILVLGLLGSFIFYNTNILNEHITKNEQIQKQVMYEKTYGKYKHDPQPLLTAIKLHAEIFPEEREVDILASYTLVNNSSEEIDTIHISINRGVITDSFNFDRDAQVLRQDEELGHYIYELKKSLQPGDSVNLDFRVLFSEKGFSNNGVSRQVLNNGTYIGYHYLPEIGYESDREIVDENLRRKHGLTYRPAIPSVYDIEARTKLSGNERIEFEAVLGTSEDQTAVTAGSLKRSWVENGRRYFHYKTDVPITHNYELFSAVYEVHKTRWKDVEIEILHHPAHTRNLDRMVNSIRSSLAYFHENIGSYPHRQIRLVEYPGSGVGLNGNPVTMSYSEGFSFYAPELWHLPLDFPFAVVAHEVSHQWWGNEINPARVEGAPLLTESLAWYTAMMVYEKTFGPDNLNLLLRVMRQEYLNPRSAADVPLLRSTDRFNKYRKGPFAMFTVKEYVGEDQVNTALKSLLHKFGKGNTPLPVSLDLYAELQQVTPDSLQYLLKDLFERNTFWELEAVSGRTKATKNGTWSLSFNIKTRKVEVGEEGKETEHPMNDHIEIGIYADSPEGGLGELLYLEKHKLKSGEQTIEIEVKKQPDLAGIDPRKLLFDRNPENNFVGIVSGE